MEMLLAGCSNDKRFVPMLFLGGEKMAKTCSKGVCHTQLELHTCLLLQYTSAMAAIVNRLNINRDGPGRMFER